MNRQFGKPPDEGMRADVRELIHEHIDSVEQLEVLLLLHRRRERDWSAIEVSEELRTNSQSTGLRLEDLVQRGLIKPGGRADAYEYGPRTAALDRAVEGVARDYEIRRVSVITLIFAKPLDRIRTFADAFRIRRESDG